MRASFPKSTFARKRPKSGELRAVFARPDGSVLDLPDVGAMADGGLLSGADPADFIPLPEGSLLLTLPGRSVVGVHNSATREIEDDDGQEVCAVAAALPLGYTRLLLPAYVERKGAPTLPLYGYAAVAWSDSGFQVAGLRTDELESWSPQAHGQDQVRDGIALRSLEFPANMLVQQLATCATQYGCFTAQNMFLRQGEAALPVSPACNARCIGCISEQEPDASVKSAQERVRRRPTLAEICELAIAHLQAAPSGMISFGQGCEGEPLLAAPLIEQAIRRVRSATQAGIVHCNTNASNPKALSRLIDAGLQSVRVSLNSARPDVYAAYYRPRGYGFDDVRQSLRLAAERGLAISLNLLTHPGVTDDAAEIDAFGRLLRDAPIAMVQTRTLNVDPTRYFAAVGRPTRQPIGMRRWFAWLKSDFPHLRIGN
ncbi:MAG TPA: radical SAM protein, partial [Candidatus Eremiobacteraceae bacterium]|nr:radical SAM protein [Candidatus Eremiobacteraceae bacterium]